jgi:hypothetical protein
MSSHGIRPPVLVLTLALVTLCAFSPAFAAETITQTFFHQLKVNTPAQSWEHRIDLPESAAMKGQFFVARRLDLRMGKLVIERELFTPTFYYVKVRLPKHFSEPKAGSLKVDLDIDHKPNLTPAPAHPEALALSDVGAARKPVFTWKSPARYAAVTLYDLDTNQTVWERVSTWPGSVAFDEGFLPLHRYRWAVKVSGENGRWSKEVQAGFKIVEQNGIVVAIPE